MVKIHNALGDRQTDTGSNRATPRRVLNLVERLEYFALIFGSDSNAVIRYFNQHVVGFSSQTNRNVAKVRIAKFYGIGD